MFHSSHGSYSNAVVGETSLDRLAIGLGGKAILPHVIHNIPQMLQAGGQLIPVTIATCLSSHVQMIGDGGMRH